MYTFSDFYTEITSFAPFEWQVRAADYMVDRGIFPSQVNVPTGLGKTSIMHCWAYALAHHLHNGTPHNLGRRYVHAVERRIIVDGAYNEAEKLTQALNSPDTPAVQWVAQGLAKIKDPANNEPNLLVTSFHGTKADNRTWLTHAGASIISTTLTQATLRLLGAGPGISARSARVHAGLLGVDTAIVVDEPHLAQAHIQTLLQVEKLSAMHVCILGATLPEYLQSTGDTILIDPNSETSEAARKRLNVSRTLNIMEGTKFPKDVADDIKENYDEKLRTVVFCNTVKTARDTAQALKSNKKLAGKVRVITSHVRPCDREYFSGIAKGDIVIATQTLEAGADFSSDALYTQPCPWPAMTQRLGRLSRYGETLGAVAKVFVPEKEDLGSSAVYGEEMMSTVSSRLAEHCGETVEVGLTHIQELKELLHGEESAWPKPPRVGIMDSTYATRLLLTPDYAASSLWIKDLDDTTIQPAPVVIAWRDNLTDGVLENAPIVPQESVNLPVYLARGVMAGSVDDSTLSDNDDNYPQPKKGTHVSPDRLKNMRVIRRGEIFTPQSAYDVQPGDTLVLHTSLGGYDSSQGVGNFDTPVEDKHSVGKFQILKLDDAQAELTRVALGKVLHKWVEWKDEEFAVVCNRSDAPKSKTSSSIVTLEHHLSQCAARATVQLSGEVSGLGADIIRAAGLHDIGKIDPTFQMMLGALPDDPPLAKSSGRHALPSSVVPDLKPHAQLGAQMAKAMGVSDMVSHLISSHHGDAGSSTYFELASAYSPWILAWAESQLRTADWVVSGNPDYAGQVDVSQDFKAAESVVLPEESMPGSIPLHGLGHMSDSAYYSALGVLAAATALDPSSRMFWYNGTPHLVSSASLEDVCSWVNKDFMDLSKNVFNTFEKNGWNITSKNHTAAGTGPLAVQALYEKFSGENVVSQLARAWAGPVMNRKVTAKGESKWVVSSAQIHGNGSVPGRLKKSSPLSVDVLTNPFAGYNSDCPEGGTDHLMDRTTDMLAHSVRVGAYRLVTLGIIAAGQSLYMLGSCGNRQVSRSDWTRFLPTPEVPQSLEDIQLSMILWRGAGWSATETSFEKFRIVKSPTPCVQGR